jgi:hypothetical protein
LKKITLRWGITYIARAKVTRRHVSADLSRVDVIADASIDTLAKVLVTDFDIDLLENITQGTAVLDRCIKTRYRIRLS